MFISGPLGARVYLLLVPLVTALGAAAAQAAVSGDFAALVDIGGGRKMYLECRGSGSPTVVLVAGLKGSAEDWNIAEKRALAEVAKFIRVCAYDRPGTPSAKSRAAVTRCASRLLLRMLPRICTHYLALPRNPLPT